MIASTDGKTIKIARDLGELVTAAAVWNCTASGQAFTVNFECTGDQACEAVRNVFKAHKRKQPTSIQFQRV